MCGTQTASRFADLLRTFTIIINALPILYHIFRRGAILKARFILNNCDNTKTLPKMRTIKEAAAELNVPVYALRQWVKAGDIPAVYAGKKALLNIDRVIEFLEMRGGEQA